MPFVVVIRKQTHLLKQEEYLLNYSLRAEQIFIFILIINISTYSNAPSPTHTSYRFFYTLHFWHFLSLIYNPRRMIMAAWWILTPQAFFPTPAERLLIRYWTYPGTCRELNCLPLMSSEWLGQLGGPAASVCPYSLSTKDTQPPFDPATTPR